MIYRAKREFFFVESPERVYPKGSLFSFDDSERGQELKSSNVFEPVEVHEMRFDEDLSNLTKGQLQALLSNNGIEFDSKMTKAELIALFD